MDGSNVNQRTYGGNSPLTDVIRQARLRELALGWLKFLAFVERQRRLDAGEPLVHLVRDDAGA